MRKTKKLTALLLAAFLGFTTGYGDVSAASVNSETEVVSQDSSEMTAQDLEQQEMSDEEKNAKEDAETDETTETESTAETVSTENIVNTESATGTEGTENSQENTETESTESVTESESTENVTEPESTESITETETTEEITDTEESQKDDKDDGQEEIGLLNYLVVNEPVVATPGTQKIFTSIGDGTNEVESARLTYKNKKTGRLYDVNASEILGDFVVFDINFSSESQTGTYKLEKLTYAIDGLTATTTFAKMGIDAAFGVNETVDTNPDDVLLTEEEVQAIAENVEANVVTTMGTGSDESIQQALEDGLEDAGCKVPAGASSVSSNVKGRTASVKGASSGIVVVLDPGHGGTDGGATHNGIVEKDINLKIAQYCRDELKEYSGVTVVMTRDSDKSMTLTERVQVAANNKATVFISLHNNSSTSSGPSGANVYYPNNNYNSNAGKIGKDLATIIESKLTDLGLASGGIHIRNSENNTTYEDGSLADYYGVIKGCKLYGIPAIIVEHAFVSNSSDVQKFLNSDSKLKQLGIADATGIAQYYGLHKGVGFSSIIASGSTALDLTWTTTSEKITGYEIYRSTKKDSGFEKAATISAGTTNWKDTGLKSGTTYYYKIRTYTESDKKTSYGNYSDVASGKTIGKTSIKSIKSKSSKKLTITWKSVKNTDNYEIYRSTSKKGTYKQVAMVSSKNTSYTDSVTAGKVYYYKIRSLVKEGGKTLYGDWCSAASGRTAKIPSKVKVSSRNSTTLRISWTPDKNASGYIITRAASKKGTYKTIATVKGGSKKYYDNKKLKTGTTYYYKVEAYNYNGDTKGYSGTSAIVSGKTLAKTSITKVVSTSNTKQTVSWRKIKDAKGYEIYQSTSQNGTYKKIKTINSNKTTSYKATGLKAGTKYYYKVRTINKVNGVTGYGDYSAIQGARVGKKPVLTVTGTSGTKIKITWQAVKDASSYDIYRSTKSNGTYKKIKTAKADATSFTDSKLKMTQKYYYKVEAKMKGYKATGTTGLSKEASSYPIRQTSISSVSANEQEALVVNWKKVNDITGYEIYRSTEMDGSYTKLTTIESSTATSYTDTTVEKSTAYWYKIRLVNTYDKKTIYGEYSKAVSGKVLAAPENVQVTPMSANQLDITWTAAPDAAGYIVYRSMQPEGEYTEIARTAGSVTTYSDLQVTAGSTYYYKIKTLGADNTTSIFSIAASGTPVETQPHQGETETVSNQ